MKKHTFRSTLAILLCLLLAAAALAGCGGAASSEQAEAATSAAASQAGGSAPEEGAEAAAGGEKTVGLIQLVEHTSLDEIREAILGQLEAGAAAAGFTVSVDYQNAQNDTSLINSICRQFVSDGVDAIIAIATPAAQGAMTATAGTDIPVIFAAVTDPVAAGLVESLDAPEGNVTGTSDAIDVTAIFELAQELTPEAKRFGFLYNRGEANSVSVIDSAGEVLAEMGLESEEKTVTVSGEVQQAARALLESCDAIFSPIDNTVASAMQVLADEAIAAGKPVYVAADSMVADGGLATVGCNYTTLGQTTADMALTILAGTPVAEVPVAVVREVTPVVNEETAAAIGVDVSAYA